MEVGDGYFRVMEAMGAAKEGTGGVKKENATIKPDRYGYDS